ncbi:MAG: hypothetical protein NVS2B16_37290 [Chloroflexota bacterium]
MNATIDLLLEYFKYLAEHGYLDEDVLPPRIYLYTAVQTSPSPICIHTHSHNDPGEHCPDCRGYEVSYRERERR